MSFEESVYANLPKRSKNQLAVATGKQSAVRSATMLYRMLGDAKIVGQLQGDEFKSRKNSTGQIKWWTRVKLALRHFFYALFSKFDKLGNGFAGLIKKSMKQNAPPASGQPVRVQKTLPQRTFQSGLGQGFGQNFAPAVAGSVTGNLIGEGLTHRHSSQERSLSDEHSNAEQPVDQDVTGQDEDRLSTDDNPQDVEDNQAENNSIDEAAETGEDTDSVGQDVDDSASEGEVDAAGEEDPMADTTEDSGMMDDAADINLDGDIGDVDIAEGGGGFWDWLSNLFDSSGG
jgi:hypothetical protein